MLTVKTLIKDLKTIQCREPFFLPIDNVGAIQLAEHTLEENENDYLEGAIVLTYNSEIIFSRQMETTDLLLTWQSLVQPLLKTRLRETQYSIFILDSLYDVELFEEELNFRIEVSNFAIENETFSYTIPKEEYSVTIFDGFMAFAEFILENEFTFSIESSYQGVAYLSVKQGGKHFVKSLILK